METLQELCEDQG